ncbi:MAG: glycosyltransferase family 2 protein [Myxococcales bacterium]|nr:MAG: glycosyltransferase family 2 protein [Myxococcales bacterium]
MRLSVCITTRNRAHSIGETLECILGQARADVEVVVVDGASTDETVAVVSEVATRYPQLRLIRPEQNSGLDADYDRAVQEASGEYIWLFADDDLLVPGAVERVLEVLREQPLVLIMDAAVYNKDYTVLEKERRLPAVGQEQYAPQDTEAFFSDCIWHLTFIGVVVMKRSFWLERERRAYYGYEFPHVGVLFQSRIPGPIRVLREPLVKIRNGVGNWIPRWFEIWMHKWPRLIWSFSWIAEARRARIVDVEPWKNPARMLRARAAGTYDWKSFKRFVAPRAKRRPELLAPLLVLAVPTRSADAVRGCLRAARGVLQRVGLA